MKPVSKHTTFINGVEELLNLVNSLPDVKICKGGRLCPRSSHHRGVEVRRAKYNLKMTLFADDGIQHFSVHPKNREALETLEEEVVKAISRRYNLIERGDKEMSQAKDPYLRPRALEILCQAAMVDEGGRVVVEDVRTILSQAGFSSKEMDNIQSAKAKLKRIGSNSKGAAVYQLLGVTPATIMAAAEQPQPSEEGVSIEEPSIVEHQVQVEEESSVEETVPIGPVVSVEFTLDLGAIGVDSQLLKASLEALWQNNDKAVVNLEEDNSDISRRIDRITEERERLEQKRSENSDDIRLKTAETERIIAILEQLR